MVPSGNKVLETHHHQEQSRLYSNLAHDHAPQNFGMAFAIDTALNLALVIAELAFGLVSNSLALISDGMHNLSDVLGLLLAWGAAWLATRPPTGSRTYGYRRASILAALANAALLFIATGAIIMEAVRRFSAAQPVESGTVIWVAGLGIVVNTVTALLFMRGREHDLNISGLSCTWCRMLPYRSAW
jgi:cobalt-zinc-cadmium efflux system protein